MTLGGPWRSPTDFGRTVEEPDCDFGRTVEEPDRDFGRTVEEPDRDIGRTVEEPDCDSKGQRRLPGRAVEDFLHQALSQRAASLSWPTTWL